MKRIVQITTPVLCILILAAVAMVLTGCGEKSGSGKKYTCPMHPEYVSDRPGKCPKCGMKLVPMAAGGGGSESGETGGQGDES